MIRYNVDVVIDMNKKLNKILEFMQKNYTWIIAIFTGLGVIVSNILKFIEYLTGTVYFSYYGLDMNLYKYSDKGFIYSLCLSFLFILALISLLYCLYQIANNIKNKKYINKNNILNLLIIISSNLCIILSSSTKNSFISIVVSFIVLIIIEIIISFIMFRKPKKDKTTDVSLSEELLNYIKILPFALIILIILLMLKTQLSLIYRTNYRITDDNKVIVYSNNEYYITLDCEIKDNNLVIYKGTQEKIDNDGIHSTYKKFENIEVK